MRSDHELYELDAHEWTEEEVFSHLQKTFDGACVAFPDVMEPYVVRLAEAAGAQESKSLMRTALSETISKRYVPRRHKLPVDQPTAEAAE